MSATSKHSYRFRAAPPNGGDLLVLEVFRVDALVHCWNCSKLTALLQEKKCSTLKQTVEVKAPEILK